MNQNRITQLIMFIISNCAYLLVFISVSLSLGFSQNMLMLLTGVFFIIYILNLWKTGIDTFPFYDGRFFFADMVSVAIYACIPALYLKDVSCSEFILSCLIIITINETFCVFWDLLCHSNSQSDQGKGFHLKWTLLTCLGIFLNIIVIILICLIQILSKTPWLIVLFSVCVLYQILMLIGWRIAEHNVSAKPPQV